MEDFNLKPTMKVKSRMRLTYRRLLTESDLHGYYECYDEAHQTAIRELDEDDHLEMIKEYESTLKALDAIIKSYREMGQYSQACIFSTLVKTLSHKITNHFEALTYHEGVADEQELAQNDQS
jgi:hypothetical protein